MKTIQQVVCALALTSLLGCTQMKQAMQKQIDADPKIRKAATDSAMKRCVDGVHQNLPTRTAQQDQKIDRNCGAMPRKKRDAWGHNFCLETLLMLHPTPRMKTICSQVMCVMALSALTGVIGLHPDEAGRAEAD